EAWARWGIVRSAHANRASDDHWRLQQAVAALGERVATPTLVRRLLTLSEPERENFNAPVSAYHPLNDRVAADLLGDLMDRGVRIFQSRVRLLIGWAPRALTVFSLLFWCCGLPVLVLLSCLGIDLRWLGELQNSIFAQVIAFLLLAGAPLADFL